MGAGGDDGQGGGGSPRRAVAQPGHEHQGGNQAIGELPFCVSERHHGLLSQKRNCLFRLFVQDVKAGLDLFQSQTSSLCPHACVVENGEFYKNNPIISLHD